MMSTPYAKVIVNPAAGAWSTRRRWSRIKGFPRSLFSYHNKSVVVTLGSRVNAERILTLVVANGSYMGDGMLIAPKAELGDGLLDVVTFGDMSRFEVLKTWPLVYKGTHIAYSEVRAEKATHITIESAEVVPVQADGEPLGECPASFWIMPSALSIVA